MRGRPKRRRFSSWKHNAYKKMRRNALLGVRFPTPQVGERLKKNEYRRPKRFMGVMNPFSLLEKNSIELDPEIKKLGAIGTGRAIEERVEHCSEKEKSTEEDKKEAILDSLFNELAELETFRQFRLRGEVLISTLKAGMTSPTELQRLVIPKILDGELMCTISVGMYWDSSTV